MYFRQFSKKLSEQTGQDEIKSQIRSYGHLIEETAEGLILVDKQESSFTDLEEARQYIVRQEQAKRIEEEVKTDLYEELSDNTIAKIIQEHHDVKVTDTLIESYIEFASSKLFTIDPVVTEIRKLNKLDKLVEGKIDYVLNDESIIAISESTQHKLNSLFGGHQDIVEYMRESKENFLEVIRNLGE